MQHRPRQPLMIGIKVIVDLVGVVVHYRAKIVKIVITVLPGSGNDLGTPTQATACCTAILQVLGYK